MVKILNFNLDRELTFSSDRELGFDPNDGYFFETARELTFTPDRDLPFGKRGVVFRGITCQGCRIDVHYLETHCPVCGHQMAAKASRAPRKVVLRPKEGPTTEPSSQASSETAPATVDCPACRTQLRVTPPERSLALACPTCHATFNLDRSLEVELLTPPRTAYQIPPAEQTAYRTPPPRQTAYGVSPEQQTAYQVPPEQQRGYRLSPQQQTAYGVPQDNTREREFISLTDFRRHSRKR